LLRFNNTQISRNYTASRDVVGDVRASVGQPRLAVALHSADVMVNQSVANVVTVVIGETLVYNVTVSPIQGTSSLRVTAAHKGLQGVVALSAPQVALIAPDIHDLTPNAITLSDIAISDGVNDTVVWSLGSNISCIGYKSNVSGSSVVLQVAVSVPDVAVNIGGVRPSITFRLEFDNGGIIEIPITLLVVEPEVVVTTLASPDDGLLEGEDTVSIVAVFAHSNVSTSPAFDLAAVSPVSSPSFILVRGSSSRTIGSVLETATNASLSVDRFELSPDSHEVFSLTAAVSTAVIPNTTLGLSPMRLVYYSAPSSALVTRRKYSIDIPDLTYDTPTPAISLSASSDGTIRTYVISLLRSCN